jgi:hypothetical protein
MRESTSPRYIAAFDTAWQAFERSRYRSRFEAFAAGFLAGTRYGRAYPDPPEGVTPDAR